MSVAGQPRRFDSAPLTSALPPTSDMSLTDAMCQPRWFGRRSITSGPPRRTDVPGVGRHVSKVPNPEVPTALDDLVGAVHQQKRYLQTQCFGGLEIDDPAKFWSVGRMAGQQVWRCPHRRLRVPAQADGVVRTCRSPSAAPHPFMLRRAKAPALELRGRTSELVSQRPIPRELPLRQSIR